MTEYSKALLRFFSPLHSRMGNSARPWRRNTLSLLQKWACLWLLLISGFVCAVSGSSCGFAGDPQAFCLIGRGGFCLAPAAICCRAPFILPLHARFGHRSQITGNTAIQRNTAVCLPHNHRGNAGSSNQSEKEMSAMKKQRSCWEMTSLGKIYSFSLGSAKN